MTVEIGHLKGGIVMCPNHANWPSRTGTLAGRRRPGLTRPELFCIRVLDGLAAGAAWPRMTWEISAKRASYGARR